MPCHGPAHKMAHTTLGRLQAAAKVARWKGKTESKMLSSKLLGFAKFHLSFPVQLPTEYLEDKHHMALDDLQPFTYPALDAESHTRILYLRPGTHDEPLEGVLQERSIEDLDIKYEAVSYVWGTSTRVEQIILSGQRLTIQKSLYDTLQNLRYPDKVRILWADGVCIDQSSNLERSHQVKLMSQIYKGCQKCLAYLATEENGSENVPSYVEKVRQNIVTRQGSWEIKTDHLKDHWALNLFAFICRPWFRRLWVLQEASLPEIVTLRFGSSEMDLDHLHQAMAVFYFSGLVPVFAKLMGAKWEAQILESVTMMFQQHNFRSSYHEKHIFFKTMSRDRFEKQNYKSSLGLSWRGEVSDPRDRFYAILSLIPDLEIGNTFVPDYNKTFTEVRYDFVKSIIQSGKGTHLLAATPPSELRQCAIPTSPSWLPMFDGKTASGGIKSANSCVPASMLDRYVDFEAVTIESDDRLRIFGYVIDEIQESTANTVLPNVNEFHKEALALLRKFMPDMLLEDYQRSLVRLCVADRGVDGRSPLGQEEVEHLSQSFEDTLESASSDAELPRKDLSFATAANHWSTMDAALGVTKKGCFGMFPVFSRPGDRIFIFPNDPGTYLLRFHPEKGVYTWLGEVFVHELDKQVEEVISQTHLEWFTLV